MTNRIALAPEHSDWAADAVRAGGGDPVEPGGQADALVWTTPGGWDGLAGALSAAPQVRWVQLPFAGIEGVRDTGVITAERTWTCAKGVYSEPVAEHALALALAGLRQLPERARATSWGEPGARTLYEGSVVVLGGGGITAALIGLLEPYRTQVTVVRRSSEPVPGAARTVTLDQLDEVLPGALVVVLALALTERTRHVIGAGQLRLLGPQAWLVNVARGAHVDTEALITVLRDRSIGGAALDVTDPEPLPDDSPLWTLPNVLITPHTANPWSTARPLLAARISENVRRFAVDRPLVGLVDVAEGY